MSSALESESPAHVGCDSQTSALHAPQQAIDPETSPPDPRLLCNIDPKLCLGLYILPWKSFGDTTVLLCADLSIARKHSTLLKTQFGSFLLVESPKASIQKFLEERFRAALVLDAETSVADQDSCRSWKFGKAAVIATFAVAFASLSAFFFPLQSFAIVFGWIVVVLFFGSLLKLIALLQAGSDQHRSPKPLDTSELPKISLLVPLFHEANITNRLTDQLARLDYPRDRLELCLVVESDDDLTKASLRERELPDWMRIVEVPEGKLRTKPRALNYAMNYTTGAIVGVYDAEDAPEPDQLRQVAMTFANAPSNVACVQGRLDYYNSKDNWLARCFTLEYASWFRVILPGYVKMGLLVPLGGTTLFFRRDILDELGNWDAHNVTEDADLGVRLARRGFLTQFTSSVTHEEANARAWPWVKQRSRWLKGYAITYAVHMRRPWVLLRELGLWRFFGFQVLFLGTLSQFVLAPILWTVAVIPFGLPHPLLTVLNGPQFYVLSGLFLLSTMVNLAANCLGAHRARKAWLMKWAPTMMFYFPLGTLGALKGLSELLWRPFYWDKTAHGIDLDL